MNETYDAAEIEQAAQQYWADNQCFETKEDLNKEKFYCLSMLPYPSGELHMGHVRNYTIGDVISRYQTLQGKNVMQPIGWDAFGLPAENAALERQLPPAEWTKKNIKKMRKTFKQLGYAFDWKREFATCDPDYYRWEQWLFVKLFKKGLIYRKKSTVNWDPVDKTVLANEQVIDGKGWRSGATIERRDIPQWFFKITDYADELLDGLNELDHWPEQVKTMQRNWIGRSEGVTIKFTVSKIKQFLEVFTTRPDTLMGCTYLGIAADHPLALAAAADNKAITKFIKEVKKTKTSEADMATQEKRGIDTGFSAIHPISKKKLPIWITNFVLMDYGTGAVMAVPAHDQRDFEFAQQYDLPVQQVIAPPKKTQWDFIEAAYVDTGKLINSEEFDGLSSEKAKKVITDYLIEKKRGTRVVNYRLRDWGISRQRYWGSPIPMIHCKHCGDIPVPEADLPVVLPEDLIPDGHGSPLAASAEFYKVKCPDCGKAAKRETDTMDTFVESSWYYARYCCVGQDKVMLDDRAKYWTPVDQYIGGVEHAVMHLLYARFMHKLLRDEGLLNTNEPFTRLLTQGMVLKDGHKMSKSKGNVVAPGGLIKQYGADTMRLFIIFAAPPEQSLEWSDTGVEGAFRYLNRLWQFSQSILQPLQAIQQQPIEIPLSDIDDPQIQSSYREIHTILRQANQDMERLQFNTVVSACMKLLNILTKLSIHNDVSLQLIQQGLSILLRLLSPITPHITHYLWQTLGFGDDILQASWPKVNCKALQTDKIELMIQVNGKLRGKMMVASCADKAMIETQALTNDNVQKFLGAEPPKKVIVVPGKLVNIVV